MTSTYIFIGVDNKCTKFKTKGRVMEKKLFIGIAKKAQVPNSFKIK